uniref:Uncharacterized protein n=1 Tax=Arundo donax TaxID=35708 RepID=A0A0A8YES7_ARUDO
MFICKTANRLQTSKIMFTLPYPSESALSLYNYVRNECGQNELYYM